MRRRDVDSDRGPVVQVTQRSATAPTAGWEQAEVAKLDENLPGLANVACQYIAGNLAGEKRRPKVIGEIRWRTAGLLTRLERFEFLSRPGPFTQNTPPRPPPLSPPSPLSEDVLLPDSLPCLSHPSPPPRPPPTTLPPPPPSSPCPPRPRMAPYPHSPMPSSPSSSLQAIANPSPSARTSP